MNEFIQGFIYRMNLIFTGTIDIDWYSWGETIAIFLVVLIALLILSVILYFLLNKD